MRAFGVVLVFLLAASGWTHAAETAGYEMLVAQVKSGNTAIDYRA